MMEHKEEKFAWLTDSILLRWFSMPEGASREKALQALLENDCLMPEHEARILQGIRSGEKPACLQEDAWDFYDFYGFFILHAMIYARRVSRWQFPGQLYRMMGRLIDNPLCPLEHPACMYSLGEDQDDLLWEDLIGVRRKYRSLRYGKKGE